MIYPSEQEFIKLAKQGNLIPVFKQLPADIDTPVSAFLKACPGKYAYLLESVETTESVGRYSFLGTNPKLIIKSKGKQIEIIEDYRGKPKLKVFNTKTDPLDEVKRIMSEFNPVKVKGLPRFCGGLVGYIGYDMVRFFEDLPAKSKDDLKLPDCYFMLSDSLIIFDHFKHTINIVFNAHIPSNKRANLSLIYRQATAHINKIEEGLLPNKPLSRLRIPKIKADKINSTFNKAEFERAVVKIKKHIRYGDIIQGVLSQRFSIKTKVSALDAYRNLRSINPSPYMYYLRFGGVDVIGSSPEMLIRCEDGSVETRPIAGTRPRGKDAREDEKLKADLLADTKERAEHLMLVDLGRNDLGRVCEFNSVQVKEFMNVEFYSHVMHIVSSVAGKLKKDKDIYDLLRASFPAGTVSGSPKIRAMQIIDEVEPVLRGPYAGCVGYFSFSGNLDTCITIRTIIMKGRNAYIQAGAGIVADSVPSREYQETYNKAKAALKSLGVEL